MPRRKKHEEHLNHEAWAIPYGDLVTLLLAFFVVMYAISSVNEGKYRILSDSLFAAFRGSPRTMEPVQVGEKQVGSGADVKTTLVEQGMIQGQPRSMLAPIPVKTGLPDAAAAEKAELNARQTARAKALQQVADQVARAMDDLVKANLVIVRRTDFWIEVEIKTDILFPSASAQLEPAAVGVIEKLGEALAPYPNSIRVEGHTDNRPIKTVAFISNWELSAARAGSVVRVLASKGVDPSRLAVIGYGENRPTHPNDTVDGRNANRRVIVVILSTEGVPSPSPTSPTAATTDGTTQGAAASTPAEGVNAAPPPVENATTPVTTAPTVVTTTSIAAPAGGNAAVPVGSAQ
ncbi:MAG: flagellar motor protein MotD [Gammaproteobacteria bacterium]